MRNVIRLNPFARLEHHQVYTILEGTASQKSVYYPPRYKFLSRGKTVTQEVIPVHFAFLRPDILDKPPSTFIDFGHRLGYVIDKTPYIPFTHNLYPADVELYEPSRFIAFNTNPQLIIDGYRTMEIFSALPKMITGHLGQLREAEEFVWDYRKQIAGPNEFKGPGEQLEFDFTPERRPTLPYSSRLYKGIISDENLEAILQKVPRDSLGNIVTKDNDTLIVVLFSSLRAEEKADLFERLKQF